MSADGVLSRKTHCDNCSGRFIKTYSYRGKKGEYCSSDCLEAAEPTGPRTKKEPTVEDKKKLLKVEDEEEENGGGAVIEDEDEDEGEGEPEKKKPLKKKGGEPEKKKSLKKKGGEPEKKGGEPEKKGGEPEKKGGEPEKKKPLKKKGGKSEKKKGGKSADKGEGAGIPFKAGSAIGKAFLLAMKGTTEKDLTALAKAEGVKPTRVLHGIQLGSYLGKTWTCKVTGDRYKIQFPL